MKSAANRTRRVSAAARKAISDRMKRYWAERRRPQAKVKDAIARPLYEALTAAGVSVWFDEAVLELGDSLRRKIDEGLARSRYGIVILSPRFFDKHWPQRELDGLVAKETASGDKAILPIWHDLQAEDVVRYSPTLADRLAGRSDEGILALVEKIRRVLAR